jgi:hypothetical protein
MSEGNGNGLSWTYTGEDRREYHPRKMWVASVPEGDYAIWENPIGPTYSAWFTRRSDGFLVYLGTTQNETTANEDSGRAVKAAKSICERDGGRGLSPQAARSAQGGGR